MGGYTVRTSKELVGVTSNNDEKITTKVEAINNITDIINKVLGERTTANVL